MKNRNRHHVDVGAVLADNEILCQRSSNFQSEAESDAEHSSESEEGTTGSDEDYQLSNEEVTQSDSDDSLSTNSDHRENTVEGKKETKKHEESLNITVGNNEHASAPDDRDLLVDGVSSKVKRHFCLYCQKFQSKLARHLELVHGKESEVRKFILLPPKNKERQSIIATIRKRGDHLYNTDRRFNKGTLIVCRRPNEKMKKKAEDFLRCGYCKGQYTRSVLRHHWKKCTQRSGKNERIILVKGRKVAGRIHPRASMAVRTYIFPYLREDDVVRSIRYDELVIIYANKQCEKYGTCQHQYQMVRAKIRLLGRFVLAIKRRDKRISTLSDVYQPRFYDATIDTVRVVAGFDLEKNIFAHPATAFSLGTLLKKTGEILRSEYIKREQAHEQRKVEDFLKLMVEDYGTSINRVVTETQTQTNRRKVTVLPTTDDIKKLHTYVKSERAKYFSQLNEKFSFEAWKALAEVTLLSLQIFNRRRPGEIERLYLEDFNSYRGLDMDKDKEMYDTLSEEGRRLARRYVRFEIRGKLGRGIPVLLDSEVLDCLNLLIKHRSDACIPEKNTYLFALPSNDKDRPRYL
ncbi:uncharacterized protein LOC107047092 [Diachasma alloeum]|uniref:uncharacterized protein LOC107047092 n=1 Tax=Diachasma alloeum TaxID=454923 RepID=UPI0007384A0E|nr:uncharacterized protein LOC107047092 [Diachasma alloeum]